MSIPRIGPKEVLIRTKAVGLCGTDIHIYEGKFPGAEPPFILGHEACGIVEKIGGEVNNVKPGDDVVVDPMISCGRCYYCKLALWNQCLDLKLIGVRGQADGACAEFFKIRADNCFRKPKNISWEEAALVDTLACSIAGVNTFQHSQGQTIAILGAGPTGLCFVQLLRNIGASKIIVSDFNECRLKLAKKFGADVIVDLKTEKSPVEIVKNETEGVGVDLVVEACGAPEAFRQSLLMSRGGGNILLFGIYLEKVDGVDVQAMRCKELNIRPSGGAVGCQKAALSLMSKRKVDIKPLISHSFRIEDLESAFAVIEKEKDIYIKGIVTS